jgi:hypothetical protein
MKRLGKIEIKSEKIIKDEELLILRGGYGICTCECHRGQFVPLGYLLTDGQSCADACIEAWVPPYERYDVGGSPVTSGCW